MIYFVYFRLVLIKEGKPLMRMYKLALKAIAKLTQIDIQAAAKTTRYNPILDSEIHIDEELINLQESIDTYHTAGDTLQKYPKVRAHILRERCTILKHCIGLIERMLRGRKLTHTYSPEDIDYAVRRLISLIVADARRADQRIDDEIMEVLRPFMTLRQRIEMREWGMDLVTRVTQVPKLTVTRLMMLRGRA